MRSGAGSVVVGTEENQASIVQGAVPDQSRSRTRHNCCAPGGPVLVRRRRCLLTTEQDTLSGTPPHPKPPPKRRRHGSASVAHADGTPRCGRRIHTPVVEAGVAKEDITVGLVHRQSRARSSPEGETVLSR